MATVNNEPRLLALRVVLLRIRLRAIRSLLHGVIALRFFIRRRRQRIAAGMQPARIRVDPRVSVPVGHRKGRLLPVLLVGAACAVTVVIMSPRHERGSLPPPPTAEAVAENPAVKPEDTAKEADLALKGENANPSTEVTQTKPATPHVVVLNPGTADQERASRAPQPSAQVRTPPSPRPPDNDVGRPDFAHKKATRDDRPPRARPPMQSYKDLQDHMLTR